MRFLHLALSLNFAAGSLAAALHAEQKRTTVCNGFAELCDRSYGNITFFGSHDSYTADTDPLDLASTQRINLTAQLDLGVRFLQAEAHNNSDGELHFCHTSCLLFDGGTVEDYLSTVNTWMRQNPTEVVSFLFTNDDNLSLTTQWNPAFEASGILDLVYVPPNPPVARSDWPTLGELIGNNTRILVFMDSFANTTILPYILREFDMIWEPPFDSTNSSFPCSINRITGPLSAADHMYLLNHNLDIDLFDTGILIPDPEQAETTNSAASILADAAGCTPLGGGVSPNFILLDFVDVGEGLQVANQLNGLC
ncbi:uncharacterized protein PHACADRAFT_184983 [Phanerochaete carnosa HHB-10118-sp]|uniref:PLC-like phosphodiesterase n=1 Tax=Phanerochaete carnosa (strain HHB-10118-sp) TaxID=650164 RepID=K5W4A6_PHACS|nr:uncharacterized protein PHACADRAFT_184983 [Phanerochaete carnosa HHB-10118-sp]EKM53985.1 hypothetical protein PHACADRAFT_184983 [Phanerochaete carnosa HHB-10118-sp]